MNKAAVLSGQPHRNQLALYPKGGLSKIKEYGFKITFIICTCPGGDKMLVENAGRPFNPVPSGTECGDNHIAYLTARGKSVAVNFLPTFCPAGTEKWDALVPLGT
jgi:hypothetical protein